MSSVIMRKTVSLYANVAGKRDQMSALSVIVDSQRHYAGVFTVSHKMMVQ